MALSPSGRRLLLCALVYFSGLLCGKVTEHTTEHTSACTTTTTHQCGTAVFGDDPKTSVLDIWCRSHDVDNLFVVDASFFPSSAAVNPALTIAAQAIRAADHIKDTDLK